MYCYQLKENGINPTNKNCAAVDKLATKIFWIKGKQTAERFPSQAWCAPSQDQIEFFFGESGKCWTPKRWQELVLELIRRELQIPKVRL
jgi:hypothetical protein